ncbi:ribosomal protein S18-alanine N-acetyltransferase [Mycetocola zhadangensis]|uniref:Ribosomal-protein-alanine N-acetyltransferase n=1 Tax=Mycetocola zhadangensis TaxID=1164595 RepID=A0A3L7J4C4_9MICO|nr:ribosomal protein S18-alanine N-acetyltransferase [Mycetocola zhadangensis]RLQ85437.1 ribosomal-protein-alanine N-acetyltransferase [Mycetocola zhadangensis]GGE82557.1 ribosomal-protein-alanine acetyltransferase [Mycetocola zhadangensis]
MTWQIRRATVADLAHILAIEQTTFGTDAWSEDLLRSELASENTYYIVATPAGAPEIVQGYAGLMVPPRAEEADIQTIAVAAEVRRMGLGRVLVRALLSEARKRGARQVFLEVRADNPGAQALYLELGFEEIAVRPGYYQPDDVDAVVMKLVLAPRVPGPAVGVS